jgi:hypothetical protein
VCSNTHSCKSLPQILRSFLFYLRGPVRDERKRAGRLAALINDNETLPIGAVEVTGKNSVGLGVKEYLSVAGGERTARRVHRYGKEFIVGGKVKEFLAIAPPERAAPVTPGNLPLSAWPGERYDVNAVLSRLVRTIGKPLSVRGKCSFAGAKT